MSKIPKIRFFRDNCISPDSGDFWIFCQGSAIDANPHPLESRGVASIAEDWQKR